MIKEHPILFSTVMVQALIAGTKTMTRRVAHKNFETLEEVKPVPRVMGMEEDWNSWRFTWESGDDAIIKCPYGQVGNLLWVREAIYAFGHWVLNEDENEHKKWSFVDETQFRGLEYHYMDNPPAEIRKKRVQGTCFWYKRPSIFMPKAASRILLEIINIRVERLQDISEQDAINEGIEEAEFDKVNNCRVFKHYGYQNAVTDEKDSFQSLWQSINGEESWNANPWVWVVEFKKVNK
jgi:hypothetical protein